jgi:hypothetical protein
MGHVTCYLARAVAVTATAVSGTVYLYLATMTVFSQVEPSRKWSVTAATAVLGGMVVVALTWSVGLLLQSCGPAAIHAIHHYPPAPGHQPAVQIFSPEQAAESEQSSTAGLSGGLKPVRLQEVPTAQIDGHPNIELDPLGNRWADHPRPVDMEGGDA